MYKWGPTNRTNTFPIPMTQQSRSGGSPAERAEALLTRSRSRFLQALREAAEEVIHHPDWLDAFTGAAGE